jgi:hypothetical protein
MKKIIFASFLIAVLATLHPEVSAQCTIAQSSISVTIKSISNNQSGGGCTAVFDLTYTISNNGGNKWSYLHFWDATAYPNIVYSNGNGPTAAVLNGNGSTPVLTTVAINYVSGTPSISNIYGPDATIAPQTTGGITVTRSTNADGTQTFLITNIKVVSVNCTPLNIKTDVWSAQDNNGKNVGCGVNGLEIRADEPLLRGLMICSDPREYSLSVLTKSTKDISWTVYKDVAPFGIFDAADEQPVNIVDPTRTLTNTGDPNGLVYDVHGPYPYTSPQGSRFDIWIKAKVVGTSNNNILLIANTCSILPVEFKSFSAVRKNASVYLAWETSAEQNAEGFEIERNTGNNIWEQVVFIPSQSQNGNSSEVLAYHYTDQNNFRGISQYRVKQRDLNNNAKISEIRSVRGLGQSINNIVYPNPTSNGIVNIVFQDANSVRNLYLMDMSGRIVRSWKNVRNNNLTIDNLNPGTYSLSITDTKTGNQSIEKIIVINR